MKRKQSFKRTVVLLLSMTMLCSGCSMLPSGSNDSQETETITEESDIIGGADEEQTEIVDGQEEIVLPYYLFVGDTADIDLNSDGVMDHISVAFEESEGENVPVVTINDLIFSSEILGVYYYVETSMIVIDDLNTNDPYLEFAVIDYGPSDDPTTNYYHFNGEAVTSIGNVPYDIYGPYSTAVVYGDGSIECETRLHIFQTWSGRANYIIAEDGCLTENVPEMYQTLPSGIDVKQIRSIKLYASNDLQSESKWVEPSDRSVTFPLTDNENWVEVCYDDGELGWIYITEFDEMESQDGEFLSSGEMFSGLCFAD